VSFRHRGLSSREREAREFLQCFGPVLAVMDVVSSFSERRLVGWMVGVKLVSFLSPSSLLQPTMACLPSFKPRLRRRAVLTPNSHAPASNTSYQKIRRSMSSDSYGTSSTATLAANQLQPARDKKGSKHADVIDTWDITGIGNAMLHQ
jgi:hypothetical protein